MLEIFFFSFNSIFVANTSIFESSPAFFSWSLFPIHLIGKYNMKSHVKKCVQRKVEYFSFTDIVFSRGRLYPAFNKISPISLKATEESREESRDYIDFCFFSFPLCSKTCGGSRDKKVQWKKKSCYLLYQKLPREFHSLQAGSAGLSCSKLEESQYCNK